MPRFPVPAYKSSISESITEADKILKIEPLILSDVGLVEFPLGVINLCPFEVPAITRNI